jgi:hypothetical protein
MHSLTIPELLNRIKEQYDGFSFDGVSRLYNPFSFVSLLNQGEFDNYWMESGSSSFVRAFIRKNDAYPEMYRGLKISRQFAR